MVGTKAGGLKASVTNKKKHGEDFYQRIGHKGGSKKGVLKGFALMSKERRSACGRKGGSVSKRGKKKNDN